MANEKKRASDFSFDRFVAVDWSGALRGFKKFSNLIQDYIDIQSRATIMVTC
jgi:hypothetical protein